MTKGLLKRQPLFNKLISTSNFQLRTHTNSEFQVHINEGIVGYFNSVTRKKLLFVSGINKL